MRIFTSVPSCAAVRARRMRSPCCNNDNNNNEYPSTSFRVAMLNRSPWLRRWAQVSPSGELLNHKLCARMPGPLVASARHMLRDHMLMKHAHGWQCSHEGNASRETSSRPVRHGASVGHAEGGGSRSMERLPLQGQGPSGGSGVTSVAFSSGTRFDLGALKCECRWASKCSLE
jgi:hypothetical protein